jgi:4-hydroxy-4-methyl-2-oxoglutarate aldolase
MDDLATLFTRYSSAMISDALDDLGIVGVINGLICQGAPSRAAGSALTVQFERAECDPSSHRPGGGVGRPLEQVLRTMAAGQMVIIDVGGTISASPWGGLASQLALQRGVRGTVVWGCCRDVDEIRAQGYPVWSVATCPRRSRNEYRLRSIGQPITVAGVAVCPGDVVMGDVTGVVVVPGTRAAEVLKRVSEIAQTEQRLEQEIRTAGFGDWDQV